MGESGSALRREAVQTVERINAAWLNREPHALGELFHEKMLITDAAGRRLAEGREAAIDTYRDFIEAAEIARFAVGATQADVFAGSAVVSYAFDIAYFMEGQQHREAGRDVFVLERVGSLWLAVWRQTGTAR